MRITRAFFTSLLLLSVACGDDEDQKRGAGGDASTASVTTSNTGGQGGGGGQGGEAPHLACGEGFAVADLEGGSWDTRFTISGFTGMDGLAPAVHDFAIDTDGTVVAAGRFQWFEGDAVAPLMRYDNGAWSPARTTWEIAPPLDGFSAIAIAPTGTMALALNDSFGEHDGEIWVDDGSGLVSVGSYTGQIRSLAWFGDALWVAGLFTLDGSNAVENLALWDGSAWSTAPGGATDGPVFELTVDGDDLLVGGAFTQVGGEAALSVASFDGTEWTPYDFDDALMIYALARTTSGDLYAGGAYGNFEDAGGVAKWTGSGWETVGGGLAMYDTRGVVSDLVAHGDTVDATGCFSSAGGKPSDPGAVASSRFARWTGSEWQSLDDGSAGEIAPWFDPNSCGDESLDAIFDATHQRLAYDGQHLFAGGFFPGAGGVLSQSIAVRSDTAWSAQGTSKIGVGGSIDLVAAGGDGCDVYGIGTFSHLGGAKTDARVAFFDGNGWVALPDPLPSDAYCPAVDVSAKGEVAVGCMTFPPEGDAVGAILQRDGNAMVQVAIDGLGAVDKVVWGPNGVLYVAGGGATGFVGKVEAGQLTIIESGFDGIVNQLDVISPTDIVVAGAFTKVGSVDAMRIAHFDGSSWTQLGQLPGQVLALGHDTDHTYVSTYDEGNGYFLLGEFDGNGWVELAGADSGITPQSYFSFNSIESIEGGLLVAGTAELDDHSGRGALVFHDGKFDSLGSGGVHAMTVGNLAVTNDSVWVSGTIAEAGHDSTTVPSVGVARYVIATQ